VGFQPYPPAGFGKKTGSKELIEGKSRIRIHGTSTGDFEGEVMWN